jgi:hypothetical protein
MHAHAANRVERARGNHTRGDSSMAAARELCAKFVAANGYCRPTRVNATDVVQR